MKYNPTPKWGSLSFFTKYTLMRKFVSMGTPEKFCKCFISFLNFVCLFPGYRSYTVRIREAWRRHSHVVWSGRKVGRETRSPKQVERRLFVWLLLRNTFSVPYDVP